MRAFIGLPLPHEIRASLKELQRELATAGADVKWVEPQNVHVTLKFLGEITEPQRQDIERRLREIGAASISFIAQLAKPGAFPSWSAPRVIWIGIEPGDKPMSALAARIEEAMGGVGIAKEPKPFAVHVTIGRVRSARGLRELSARIRGLQWQPPKPWTVSTVTLYESRLSPGGPTYAVLAETPLGRSVEAG
ncbi:MAG: RNA 2',3'-cyclic phosphodiesterase [Candidatus Omnitrophica bacterium CG11_big_fil_rev_8_21_14_0_20_63_9]|nr:MAG: RNA 2',3'-cyclic phosphodiesterase [Candidatus Omnitrophica bacterium CG11_big_fil_rev_8_21_14_0_20_63_9]